MSVGLLLVAHGDMGQELIRVVRSLIGELPLRAEAVSMPNDCDNGVALREVHRRVEELDTGDGVLVMTDLYGATPSNICGRLNSLGDHTRRVSGLNLPMLMRVMNYAQQSLPDLAETALSGGRNGIVLDPGQT
jgi:PTS system ascorbate-specific IIA component